MLSKWSVRRVYFSFLYCPQFIFVNKGEQYKEGGEVPSNPKYEDKAAERRKKKGSDNPYQKDDPAASVHR